MLYHCHHCSCSQKTMPSLATCFWLPGCCAGWPSTLITHINQSSIPPSISHSPARISALCWFLLSADAESEPSSGEDLQFEEFSQSEDEENETHLDTITDTEGGLEAAKILTMNELTEVRTDGNSLLKAVYLSRLRLTRLLLEGGAYINESNEHGETPLMVACMTHHLDSQSVSKQKMVRYLLENGADPNIQDKTGKTALTHACLQQAGAEILSLLLSGGADPTLEDHAGLSALVYAVSSGNRDVLRILLDACKAKGKEVVIITTNKLLSGHHMTKQYLNVPPPLDLEERLHYTPSCKSPDEIQLRTPPHGPSASASPQPGSFLLGLRSPQCLGSGHGLDTSQPGSPIQHPIPLCIPNMNKRLNPQWSKSHSLLLQQSQASSLTEELLEITGERELSFRLSGLTFQGRPPSVLHHSTEVKDAPGLLKAQENTSGNENRRAGGRRSFGRKMSYDSAESSLHSASHPNLLQDVLFPYEPSCPAGEDSSDSFRQLNISSLQNVVCRRNIGIDHYCSDSQLPQFGSQDISSKNRAGAEGHKLVNSRSSTMLGSRESLETSAQRRNTVGLERRGSGALLLDHIAHTRPGYLPPLNSHAPIPDIGIGSSSSYPLGGSNKTLNGILTGSKPILPCAPIFPRELKAKKMLWRRHSMQSEQIKQLASFQETVDH